MVYCNRPAEKREEREEKVYDCLEQLSIPFQRVDHKAAHSIEDCEQIEQELQVKICKNLFLCNRQKTSFYLLLMEGDKRFVTKDFSKSIGASRLSFAGEADLLHYLNVTPGSASIFGLLYDKKKQVHLYIDQKVAEEEYLGCHPCKNTSSLKIKTKDILEIFLPSIGVIPHIIDLKPQEESGKMSE